VLPEDRERAARTVMLAVEQARAGAGTAAYRDEYRVQGRDGGVLWVEGQGAIEPGEGGLVMRGVVRDITERKLHEEQQREGERRKDEFLAMLAHELRNPLAPIRNAAELLRRRGSGDPAMQRASEVIERQVTLLVRLVDDLLDVSRVTRGKIGVHKRPIEVAAVVRHAVETSRPIIDARAHDLAVLLPPEPIALEGDLARLAQVVSNLLHNAAKYTEPGGRITLSVERAGAAEQPEAVLRVRDTGRGIEPSALGSVFDLFYQGSHTLDRSEGGLGIGLALVKSVVEMHGGRVEAHSAGPGQGSEIVVRLPCLAGPAAGAALR
jgi:signal transduction histidine kinase